MAQEIEYMRGFGNEFESEAKGYEGALPEGQINPQKCKFNLFCEQLSGSAFTAPRSQNKRSWLYRIRPSVCHKPFRRLHDDHFLFNTGRVDPNQMRWSPFEGPAGESFVQGLKLLAFSDGESGGQGISIYIYMCKGSNEHEVFSNSDGDLLIVPQVGTLQVMTEFGKLQVEPNEIVVLQQGMKFTIASESQFYRGYVLEVKGNHFELPNLGPIGANCLANPRDFLVPKARIDSEAKQTASEKPFELYLKFKNELHVAQQQHTPYDVAAWFGNYVPYKYNLDNFVTINTVSRDHPDPSIFTVLTCPSLGKPGTALADFVIFPPRWECAVDTFRPPYFHRNCMTEFMGLIKGQYQAKSAKFAPGGGSLHQSMMAHGPDEQCFQMASEQDTSVPKRVADETMAFMFETCFSLKLTQWAIGNHLDSSYHECWQNLAKINVSK